MSWKVDDIDFRDYGVGVMRTTGLLDMPKLIDAPNDWLDVDGVDYWQDAADIHYNDREIALHCWIAARATGELTGYEVFVQKVQAFYDALTAEGLRTLSYGTAEIAGCYVEKAIEMPRKTAYVSSLQVGMFTLRLTVPGNPNYFPLQIKRWTPETGTVTKATVLTRNLEVRKTLQGDIYATCSFQTNTKLNLEYYDYIRINSNGVADDDFFLSTAPPFKKAGTNVYEYNLRFEHQSKWLDDSQFVNDLGETDFYYYATMDEVVDLIITNHNRSWFGNFQKGTVVSTVRKNHKFTAESCLEVLRRLCSEYEIEYELKRVMAGVYEINVKELVANDKEGITFEYGKGKGLYDMERQAFDRSSLCTILFAYGAARNIPAGYRNGMARLSFDTNPLSNNDELLTGDGPCEKTVFFDDIYPRRTGTVTAYTQILKENLTVAQAEVFPDGMYIVTDSSLDFDINEYLSEGLTAKIRFNTGDNAGYEFEIFRYDASTHEIFLIPFKDERGTLFPNPDFHPAVSDEYVLVDIEMPESYVTTAEAELAAAAQDYIDVFSIPRFPYRVRIDPAFMKENPGGFEIGERIHVIDEDFGIDGYQRISELLYQVLPKRYEFTLSDKTIYSRLKRLEMQTKAAERALEDTKKDTVESMRKEKETATELKNRLIDPSDDKFASDRIVRPKSLDPGMLALDASTIQWSIKDALVDCNVDGDYDKVTIGAGTITYHNWETKDRYNISKAKDTVEGYQPQRTWTVEATEFNLLSPDAHWMYAKLNLASGSTSCVILVDTDHIEGKYEIEDNYLYLKLGDITSSASPRYASMIWGNVKNPTLSHITDIVSQTIINEGDTIVNIVKNEAPVVLGGYKESFLIENTTNTTETQYSTWAVIAFNELVGEFKAVVMVRNKSTNTVVMLMNILSFDYTESPEVDLETAMVTDGTITLTVGIDPTTKLLYATVASMPADAKRIHFCFERCVLSERIVEMGNAEGNIEFGGEGEMMALEENYLGNAEGNIEFGGEAALEAPEDNYMGNAEGNIEFGGSGTIEDSTPPANPVNLGLLYNYYALLNARGFLQAGWRFPTQTELNALDDVYGGAGLKETGTDYWVTGNGTNASGFNGRGSGYRRNTDGGFQNLSENMIIWGSTISSGRVRCGNLTDATIYTVPLYYYASGMSVRPIKESTTLEEGETTEDGYTDNDGNTYPTVCIGAKEYVAANLKQTKYNDGTSIAEITDNAAWIADTTGAMCAYNNDWDNV